MLTARLLLPLALVSMLAPAPAQRTLTFAILEDYDKGEDLSEAAKDFALMRELGIRTWRGSLGWDDYEPARGTYDFAWLHQFAELAAANGIALRPYLGYTPEWAGAGPDGDGQPWNQPPRDLDQWSRFVSAIAKELAHHPNVQSIEIYNEENVRQWWEGTPRQYAGALARAASAVRAARWSLTVVFGGLVFPDVDWIESVCSASRGARAFDVLPIHAYPETWTPDGVTVENYFGSAFESSFLRASDRACGRKRVWINETGFATTAGRTERDQAAWWIRAAATFASLPRVDLIGVYEIKNLSAGKAAIGDTPNYHLGITRADRSKKLAFGTVQMLAALLGGAPIREETDAIAVRPLSDAGELHHRVFRRSDGARILIVWNRTADQQVGVSFPAGTRDAIEYGLDGAAGAPSVPPRELQLRRGIPRLLRLR